MQKMTRAALLLAGMITLGFGLAGCTGADPVEKTIGYTTDSVTLDLGEKLVVELGSVSASIGTNWAVTQEPDPAVLSPGESVTVSTTDEENPPPGTPSDLSFEFMPVGKGTTVIEIEYQFRGSVPESPSEQKSARIEVTVK